jgi:Protein of unknown function (DUF3102)
MELSKMQNVLAEQLPALEAKKFDYDSLDNKIRAVVKQHTIEIKSLVRRTAQDNIDIGGKLTEVKQQLGHGKFEEWLKAEFEWSEWTARKFMQVAKKFKSVNFTDLSVATSALYLLASASTPEYACKEVLERAIKGEVISYAKAKTIVTQHQEAAQSSMSGAPNLVSVEVPVETQIRDYSSVPHLALEDIAFQSVTEQSEDKLPKKQEALADVKVSNFSYEMGHDIEKSDDLLDDQVKADVESPFLVGDLMYLNDLEQQVVKLLGHVAEVGEVTANEVVIKISLQ